MTAMSLPEAQVPYGGPRLGAGRIIGLVACAASCLSSGLLLHLAVTGFLGPATCEPATPCHDWSAALGYGAAALFVWVLGLTTAAGLAAGLGRNTPDRLPTTAIVLGAVLLGYTGAALGLRMPPELLPGLGVLTVLTLAASALGERGLRRRRREFVAARTVGLAVAARGVSSTGVVVVAEPTDRTHRGDPELMVTVRYPAGDGSEHRCTEIRFHPASARPRVGDRMAVRYDPSAPGDALLGELLPGPVPVRDAGPSLAVRLERLAERRRDGELDGTEYEEARRRLLAGG
ncbi:DUF3592 domain-containing protein [Kitasatospora sp. NPDC101183]|uniref:DUF3592 domain-containing protein n=1 Tax=Kitasatospora sp. NPDC101183 TaxID=3364100 RepID=UPI0037F3AE24